MHGSSVLTVILENFEDTIMKISQEKMTHKKLKMQFITKTLPRMWRY